MRLSYVMYKGQVTLHVYIRRQTKLCFLRLGLLCLPVTKLSSFHSNTFSTDRGAKGTLKVNRTSQRMIQKRLQSTDANVDMCLV